MGEERKTASIHAPQYGLVELTERNFDADRGRQQAGIGGFLGNMVRPLPVHASYI